MVEKKISFIHAADLHLDSPFNGLSNLNETVFQEVRQSTFVALDNLVAAAIDKKVDFVLLVGDLFDNERQSLKAQIKLRNAFQALERHHIDVYVSYGNHDFIKGNSYPIVYPENVHVFPDEQVRSFTYQKNSQALAAIYGFSYENRAVTNKKTAEYHIVDSTIPFHIAMLHGSIESNTEHDTYAPFQLGELTRKHFDYWALGHIHKRQVLAENPYVIYPGNIQGRNRKETGEKGCYLVEISASNQQVEFIPLQAIQYNHVTIDVTNCDSIHSLEPLIKNKLTELDTVVPQLIDLALQSNDRNLINWKNDNLVEDIIEIVNESLLFQQNWLYIYRVTILDNTAIEPNRLKGEHFIGELSNRLEEVSINDYLSELFQHKEARKYMDALAEDEEEQVKEEAFQLLIHQLLKE
ncbi:metallophosphoesterase family protein [Ornithinibacillus contaminans]|uniref:metallophosphoesterase family protein n=1 Tax=Ornithinibacillus contaminans TaxID=694055 RepID=UPI00064D92F8|nr:DNA repair exonuclease [Ornithinibacillus contaminans]